MERNALSSENIESQPDGLDPQIEANSSGVSWGGAFVAVATNGKTGIYGFVRAGQYNSMSILFDLAKHGAYAPNVTIEALTFIFGLVFVIPRYDIIGGTWPVVSRICLEPEHSIQLRRLVGKRLTARFA
jgi:hypothetical protein